MRMLLGRCANGVIPACLLPSLKGNLVNTSSGTRAVSDAVKRPQPSSPDLVWLGRLPHRDCLELDAAQTAPREARRWLARVLPQWSLPEFETAAALIATELITNAVVATVAAQPAWARAVSAQSVPVPPPIRVWLCGGPSVVAVLAWDACVLAPVVREAGTSDEDGRGLAIVAALSAGWGFYYPAEFCGKVTWAIINSP
jgi:hypothetical protein